MVVAVGTASLYLPSIFSLKEKRSLVKSLIERIKARYNVSVAEQATMICMVVPKSVWRRCRPVVTTPNTKSKRCFASLKKPAPTWFGSDSDIESA
jgi:hypothetical protein